ncbi:hypothetical protein M9H77_32782 [Catharanthus roseus]|uniref:Uncharacterized protein n=1 Tax=Catharanthus roseus TaxID=4058 RepID=A0ACC0A5R4_CATRO|nr:hypothetical protein M9H77_32782 [Catharanthus roseus]
MSQISDGVWKIIRSGDGMKAEIMETVQSVYNTLLNPKVNECSTSTSPADLLPAQKEHENNRSLAASTSGIQERLSDGEPHEPPGFSMRDHSQNNTNGHHDLTKESRRKSKSRVESKSRVDKTRDEPTQEAYHFDEKSEPSRVSKSPPPGTSEVVEQQSDDGGEDDPDLPPGFG